MFLPLILATLPLVPNPALTPGAVFSSATRKQVCTPGYTATVRHVSSSTRRKVFLLYGINPKRGKFEVDHLISLELGGSNDIRNLWPQSYTTTPWNARIKDRLENRLHGRVCAGLMTLKQAQKAISGDWVKTYRSLFPNGI